MMAAPFLLFTFSLIATIYAKRRIALCSLVLGNAVICGLFYLHASDPLAIIL